jgi:hypothetical protein
MSTEKHLPEFITLDNFRTKLGFYLDKESVEFRDKVAEFRNIYPEEVGWTQQIFNKDPLGNIISQDVRVLTVLEKDAERKALIPKPQVINFDVLGTISRNESMRALKNQIHAWLAYDQGANYKWINLIFNRPTVAIDKSIIALFNQIIDEDVADANNPITSDVATALKALLTEIGDRLADG